MVIRINEASDVPIYLQLRNEIVMGISDGRLKAGEKLPTVRSLAEEIGVNTMTVSKAYQLLKTEGYILSDRRSGARVRMQFEKRELKEESLSQLKKIVSEARVNGMTELEFVNLCEALYRGEESL